MGRWEYRVILRDVETFEDETEAALNGLGDDGYELVTAFMYPPAGERPVFIFKRPREREGGPAGFDLNRAARRQ